MPERSVGQASGRGLRDRSPLSRFETFLFAAVATVLITRAYLVATGYPQIGGGGTLHVAHVLWGGLLMGVAIVAVVIVPGSRVKLRAALIGGIGFGLFIDEVGKFLTTDTDYFFQPSIAVMYTVFVGFYLVVIVVLRRRKTTDKLRLATGLEALSDQVLGQLPQSRREFALVLLGEITEPTLRPVADEVAVALRADASDKQVGFEHRITVWRDAFGRVTKRVLGGKVARRIVIGLFVFQAVATVLTLIFALTIDDGQAETVGIADNAAQISGMVVTVMVIVGIVLLMRGRYLPALRALHAAILVDLLVTEVFLFASEQFGALFGFVLTLVMLLVLRIAIRNAELEQRQEQAAAPAPVAAV